MCNWWSFYRDSRDGVFLQAKPKIWAYVDQDPHHYMASLGHNELMHWENVFVVNVDDVAIFFLLAPFTYVWNSFMDK